MCTCAPGTISMWGGTDSNYPNGWLLCDGSPVNQDDYPALYSAIGANFGAGAPAGMFYLPDLQGRFVRGQDPTGKLDPDAKNRRDMHDNTKVVGATVGSVQEDAFQDHVHLWGNLIDGSGVKEGSDLQIGGTTYTASAVDDQTPCRTSKETRPVNAYLVYIIKY